uniref:RNase H type-1 domain-containing protein n=1 Tax=Setaria italica TaxID=4555 RepID=K4A2A6_SETIT
MDELKWCELQSCSTRVQQSEISFIINEAKDHGQLLESWEVVQVRRECNLVAHELAQLARRNIHTACWLGQAPTCVLDLVTNECNHLPV